MDKTIFEKAIWDLSIYFERKPPNQEAMNAWYEQAKHIPGRLILAIVGEVKKLEAWPRNLPAYMSRLAAEFQDKEPGSESLHQIHPRRKRPWDYAKKDCGECHGRGLTKFKFNEIGQKVFNRTEATCLCSCTDWAELGG